MAIPQAATLNSVVVLHALWQTFERRHSQFTQQRHTFEVYTNTGIPSSMPGTSNRTKKRDDYRTYRSLLTPSTTTVTEKKEVLSRNQKLEPECKSYMQTGTRLTSNHNCNRYASGAFCQCDFVILKRIHKSLSYIYSYSHVNVRHLHFYLARTP